MSTAATKPGNAAPTPTTRGHVFVGYATLVLFVALLAFWSSLGSFSGAVIAMAQFVVDSAVKKVQHQNGGIIADLAVREGDFVHEGDVLIRLDDTQSRANLQVITNQIDELEARAARLVAERDQRNNVIFDDQLLSRAIEPTIAALMAAETRLFTIRLTAKNGQRSQLAQRIKQLRAEIVGLTEQRHAKARESTVLERELGGLQDLYARKLAPLQRVSQLEREAINNEGQRAQLTAQIAQAEGRITEIELQILQIAEDTRAEAMKELREIGARLGELRERRVAAEDHMRRNEIRAPVSGFVQQLAVHSRGGVISAAEPAMLIVPSEDRLQLDARVMQADYDQVHIGQEVSVRIHAFNQRTTPQLRGIVTRMAQDVTRDNASNTSYYLVRVSIPGEELERIRPFRLTAGMQAEVYLKTTDRTLLAYMLKPITDQFERSFRER